MELSTFLEKLDGARQVGEDQWEARCPGHEDRTASLSVGRGDDGRILLHCHADCAPETVVGKMGLKLTDLMPPSNGHPAPQKNHKKSRTFATIEDAVNAYGSKLGTPSRRWDYHDADGELIGAVLRWDKANGKEIRPVSFQSGKWHLKGMAVPHPLYRSPSIANASLVFVLEGEKAADAAIELGLVATTSPHGAKSAGKADWSPLAGKDVVGIPDHDDPGEKYVADVGCLVLAAGAKSFRIIRMPEICPDD